MKLTILEHPTTSTAKDFKARLEAELEQLKGELNASVALDGFSRTGWARIDVAGEDREILTELITRKFGLAHTDLREIEAPAVYVGQIVGSGEKGLKFDLGLEGGDVDCTILTSTLMAQLADGKPIPLRQLADCYCLYPGVRAGVRIASKSDHTLEGWLSDNFVDAIGDWVTTGLDRIQVFDCFKKDAESAVLRAHLSRDVIAVDSMTLTLQSVVCKLGTDAVGLIPKLGRLLRNQTFRPFLPKKIIGKCRPW
jgi:hypothetical protein